MKSKGLGVVVLGMAVVAACTKANPAAKCTSNGVCTDPSFPYCDADGSISGDPSTCIAVSCTAGEFKSCVGTSSALVCNAGGNGYDTQSCAYGCAAGSGCEGSGSGGGGAHVSATWKIKDTAGAAQACPAAFDTAALVNQPVDAAGNNAGAAIVDLFDCAAGAGTSAALPATTYKTFIEITDHAVSNIYATSVAARLDVTTTDLSYSTDILTDGGYFSLAWILKGATSNNTLTCAQAGVSGSRSGVEAVSTIANSTMAATDQFTCEDGQGVTSGLPAGTYAVSVDAFTLAGSVGTAPTLANKAIQGPNVVTDLGTITIPITGM